MMICFHLWVTWIWNRADHNPNVWLHLLHCLVELKSGRKKSISRFSVQKNVSLNYLVGEENRSGKIKEYKHMWTLEMMKMKVQIIHFILLSSYRNNMMRKHDLFCRFYCLSFTYFLIPTKQCKSNQGILYDLKQVCTSMFSRQNKWRLISYWRHMEINLTLDTV